MLQCNAIKKYSVRFEDSVVYISEVCLDSYFSDWPTEREPNDVMFPYGSTPSHLWSSLAKKIKPKSGEASTFNHHCGGNRGIGTHLKWHHEIQSAKFKMWKHLIRQETCFLWLKIGREKREGKTKNSKRLKIGRKKEKRRENQNNKWEMH